MRVDPSLDKRIVRLRFDRAAVGYDAAAVLQREVGGRMLKRLDLVKLDPLRVLDAGSGTGWLGRQLVSRYARARIVELDLSLGMLRAGTRRAGGWRRVLRRKGDGRRQAVCADMERIPLATGSVELICSNLALAWLSRLDAVLSEFHRVLTRGGLLMFTTFGPDTLKELRASLEAQGASSVHPFIDMHDIGDLLVRTGFADPVMDMERLTLTYRDFGALLSELRAAGGRTAVSDRPQGLRGRAWRARLEQRYAAFRVDGRLPATFEIVYGHAWKPEHGPRVTRDGSAVIRFEPRPGRR